MTKSFSEATGNQLITMNGSTTFEWSNNSGTTNINGGFVTINGGRQLKH